MDRSLQKPIPADRHNARRLERNTVRIRAKGQIGGSNIPATVHNLTKHGILIEVDRLLAIGEIFEIELPGQACVKSIVRWVNDGYAGCEFDHEISSSVLSAAKLLSPHHKEPLSGNVSQSPDFGSRLRDARKGAGITQVDLAKDMHVSSAAVSNWENGKAQPKSENHAHLLELFPQLSQFTAAESITTPQETQKIETLSRLKTEVANILNVNAAQIRIRIEIEA